MSMRKRSPSGQFSNEQDSPEVVDLVDTPRKLTKTGSKRKSQDSFVKSALRIVLSGKKEEAQISNTESLMRDCRIIYRSAIFFSIITRFLHTISQISKIVVATYFVLNIFMKGILYSLTTTLVRCLFGREQNCYTRVMDILFPADIITTNPYLEVTVRESGLIGADHLIDISFPLTINNPIIQLAILAILVCNSFFLAYFHKVLIKVARLTKDASPELNFVTKYGELPAEL